MKNWKPLQLHGATWKSPQKIPARPFQRLVEGLRLKCHQGRVTHAMPQGECSNPQLLDDYGEL